MSEMEIEFFNRPTHKHQALELIMVLTGWVDNKYLLENSSGRVLCNVPIRYMLIFILFSLFDGLCFGNIFVTYCYLLGDNHNFVLVLSFIYNRKDFSDAYLVL